MGLLDRLALPEEDAELDDPQTTARRRALIESKPFLKTFYENAYRFFAAAAQHTPPGPRLEIGCGAGFLKERMDRLITSEILPVPTADLVCSGLHLPCTNKSLSAMFLLDAFHHLPDAEAFLREAARTLKPGGALALMEPANTCWGRFIYQHFHHEGFDPAAPDWTLPPGGPLSTANGALPWIVFVRDRARFAEQFPGLTIERIRYVHPLLYLLSGGFTLRQLLPGCCLTVVQAVEWLARPVARWSGMFMQIVVRVR